MILKNKTKKRGHATPWDSAYPTARSLNWNEESPTSVETTIPDSSFELQGFCCFDLASCTSEGVRKFLWAGIHLLAAKAKSEGLSDDEINGLVKVLFENFHAAAGKIWEALQQFSRGSVLVLVQQKAIGLKTAGKVPETEFIAKVLSESPAVKSDSSETSDAHAIQELNRAFLRRAARVRASRERRNSELNELADD